MIRRRGGSGAPNRCAPNKFVLHQRASMNKGALRASLFFFGPGFALQSLTVGQPRSASMQTHTQTDASDPLSLVTPSAPARCVSPPTHSTLRCVDLLRRCRRFQNQSAPRKSIRIACGRCDTPLRHMHIGGMQKEWRMRRPALSRCCRVAVRAI